MATSMQALCCALTFVLSLAVHSSQSELNHGGRKLPPWLNYIPHDRVLITDQTDHFHQEIPDRAQNIKVCDLGEGVADKLEKIRLRKEKTNFALIFKIKDEVIVLEDELEDMSVDELQAELPTSQPRYVVLSYCYKHDDGRTSYPLLFIFLSPSGCKPEQQMMYAGCKLNFVKASGLTKVNEIRNVEELTEEYIQEKLSFYH
ncbi:glia maturation factor beta-like isoform X1 [Patiria miniata]|uniref:ADF-H domain-containing protein n=1 Tax=Patiria miniata TaxID=46514 RepID=A0A914BDR9_PATMI|nr:glia maturation factor beta-like isoform X1 [Patiria miniata]